MVLHLVLLHSGLATIKDDCSLLPFYQKEIVLNKSDDSVQDVIDEPVEDVVNEPVKDVVKEPVEDVVEEPVKSNKKLKLPKGLKNRKDATIKI